MNISKPLLPLLATAGITLTSCIVPGPYGPRVFGPPIVGIGVYDTLPVGYVGDSYWYGGRYYYGGRYESGRYYWHGRYYGNRYSHGGHYYYGGRHEHHDRH